MIFYYGSYELAKILLRFCSISHHTLFLFLAKGLQPVAEKILSYLDADSLRSAELVCNEWHRVISDGMLWKKLIHRKVLHDPLWKGLGERRGW